MPEFIENKQILLAYVLLNGRIVGQGASMKWVLIFLVCLTVCSAAEVGDFAPLKVGNTWKYLLVKNWSQHGAWFGLDSGLRTIEVVSVLQKLDTSDFTVQFTDSIFFLSEQGPGDTTRSVYPDTVFRDSLHILDFGKGIKVVDDSVKNPFGRDGMFKIAFQNHTFEESQVYPDSIGNPGGLSVRYTSPGGSWKLIKDVGLVQSDFSGGSGPYAERLNYRLVAFNGTEFQTVVVLPRKKAEISRNRAPIFRNSVYLIKGKNILGRAIQENSYLP